MRYSLFVLCITSVLLSFGQNRKYDVYEYIEMFAKISVSEMERTGIPASITLAQGILESGSGNSRLATKGNNHFGIKCHDWNGDTILEDDDDLDECFRKYPDPTQSYFDHSEFLLNRKRYSFLFNYKKTEYKKWAKGLKQAGYATNPKYADKLIEIIERYSLDQFDTKQANEIQESPLLAELIKISRGEEIVPDQEELVAENTQSEEIADLESEELKPSPKENIANASIQRQKNATGKEPIQKEIKEVPNNYYLNGILVNTVMEGENLSMLEDRLEVRSRLLKKYNEWESQQDIIAGLPVYLQPKRKRNRRMRTYTTVAGDNWQIISQKTGVRISSLTAINNANEEDPIAVNTEISVYKRNRNSESGFFASLFGSNKSESKEVVDSNPIQLPSEEEFNQSNIPNYSASSIATKGEIDFGIPEPEEQERGTEIPSDNKSKSTSASWLKVKEPKNSGTQSLVPASESLEIDGVSDLVYVSSEKVSGPDTNNPQNRSGKRAGFFETESNPIKKNEETFEKVENPVKKNEGAFEKVENPIKKNEETFEKVENPVKKNEGAFEKVENPIKKKEGTFENVENPIKKKEGTFENVENPIKKKEGAFENVENPVKKKEGAFENVENPVKKPEGKFEVPDTTFEQKSGYYNPKNTSSSSTSISEIVHKVKAGETLYAISKRYGVEIETIMRDNDLRNYNINIGQKLLIRKEIQ